VVAVVVAEPVAAAVLAGGVATEEDVQVDVDEGELVAVPVGVHAGVSITFVSIWRYIIVQCNSRA
jgi:hypothetical protein